MEADNPNRQAVQQQLDRILASAGFARNERLSRFLRFVIECHLQGRDSELKESVIAIEVFGRKPDYDPKQDSIVRTEAGRLRARLAEYYADEGSNDTVVIELPKGGYTPAFRRFETATASPPAWYGKLQPKWVLALVLALLAAGAGWWWSQRETVPIFIAVLPLEGLAGDPDSDYFADGLTAEIIHNLSQIEGLAVRSRTSSFAFKGKPRNMRETGRQLQVDYILEGSVSRVGELLRVNTQLVRVDDDLTLWSGRFDRELTDIFAIQDEISRGIVNSLRLELGRGQRRYETDLEAYDLYLRARALTSWRRPADQWQAVDLFEQVIHRDPAFTPAYAGLAATYARLAGNLRMSPFEAVPKMRVAAEKAIQLDPLLAEAHAALGLVYQREHRWGQSDASFRRAIELDPSRSATYVDSAIGLWMRYGRTDETIGQLRLAEKADPLSGEVHWAMAWALISARQYADAVRHCQQALSIEPDHLLVRQLLARAWFFQGKTEQALELFENKRSASAGFLGYAYARTGRREEAQELVAASPGKPNHEVLIFAGLGDKDHAFEALDRMADLQDMRVGIYLTYPELSDLGDDPRMKAFRMRIGLPESMK